MLVNVFMVTCAILLFLFFVLIGLGNPDYFLIEHPVYFKIIKTNKSLYTVPNVASNETLSRPIFNTNNLQIGENKNVYTNVFVETIQNAHAMFFRNLEKEGALLAAVGYSSSSSSGGAQLLIPLSFHKQQILQSVHNYRQDVAVIDQTVKLLYVSVGRKENALQLVELKKLKLKKDFLEYLTKDASRSKEWISLEQDKLLHLKEINDKIDELEQLRISLYAEYEAKQSIIENNVIPIRVQQQFVNDATLLLENTEKLDQKISKLYKDIAIYDDSKLLLLRDLDKETKKAKNNNIVKF